MDERLTTATTALVMGMATVFAGLTALQMMMYLSNWFFRRKTAVAGGAPEGAGPLGSGAAANVVQPTEASAIRVEAPEGHTPDDDLLAAIALAIHLDDHAMREAEAQRLTWTAMSKPFSPWVMDGKTSLHTRRIRWRANAAPGTIVRGNINRS